MICLHNIYCNSHILYIVFFLFDETDALNTKIEYTKMFDSLFDLIHQMLSNNAYLGKECDNYNGSRFDRQIANFINLKAKEAAKEGEKEGAKEARKPKATKKAKSAGF